MNQRKENKTLSQQSQQAFAGTAVELSDESLMAIVGGCGGGEHEGGGHCGHGDHWGHESHCGCSCGSGDHDSLLGGILELLPVIGL